MGLTSYRCFYCGIYYRFTPLTQMDKCEECVLSKAKTRTKLKPGAAPMFNRRRNQVES